MTDASKATGGPVDPGNVYWIGEHGPAPFVLPERAHRWISELPQATFEVSGLFDSDLAAYKAQMRMRPVTVRVEIPASRWQAFKLRLRDRCRWLRWLPVRMAFETEFVGRIEPWPTGEGFTINQQPEEH